MFSFGFIINGYSCMATLWENKHFFYSYKKYFSMLNTRLHVTLFAILGRGDVALKYYSSYVNCME